MRDRLASGGFGINLTDVDDRKKGLNFPKALKLLVKGKDLVELVEDKPKEA